MLGKPRILSLFLNSFNKFNKNMSTHVRSSIYFIFAGDPKHLHRAVKFAEFLTTPMFQQNAKTPDSPYSLYEGWAGTVCYLADLLQPQKAEFPLFDVFDG